MPSVRRPLLLGSDKPENAFLTVAQRPRVDPNAADQASRGIMADRVACFPPESEEFRNAPVIDKTILRRGWVY